MRYSITTIFVSCVAALSGYSQGIDSANIAKADKMVSQFFDKELIQSNYLLYNLDDKYIVIKEIPSAYYQIYYVRDGKGVENKGKIRKKNKLLRKAFNEESCSKSFVYSESDSLSRYMHPHSRYIYYYLSKGGNKKCEFNLPALYSIDVSRTKVYPLDENIQKYLSKKLFSNWKD